MGIEALGAKPRRAQPAPAHKVYRPLDLTIDLPIQVWAADIAHIPAGNRASAMLPCQGGESPSDVKSSSHVAEGDCVATMRGGEQPKAKEQPVG